MSQENVDLVLSLLPPPDVDVAQLFRDDDIWAASRTAFDPIVHQDFECVNPGVAGETTYAGVDGFREFWLDWLTPWAAYRLQVTAAIDCDDAVLLLADNTGCPHGSAREVNVSAASIFRFRDGKVVRYEGYLSQAQALEAVGLAQ
jgi:ketosteroid isomerase-like protein